MQFHGLHFKLFFSIFVKKIACQDFFLSITWSSPMQFHCKERRLMVWLCRRRRPNDDVWRFFNNYIKCTIYGFITSEILLQNKKEKPHNTSFTIWVENNTHGLWRSWDPALSYLWMNAKKSVTVFPLMLLPFMKTVFTEVLLIRPWTLNSEWCAVHCEFLELQ